MCFVHGGGVMSRGPQRFRLTDIVKVVKATKAAGLVVERIEFTLDGKMVVVSGQAEPSTDPADVEGWDRVK
ncbi:hypothetical protein BraRD5C2_24020 [Bradyrhizobium sp. RD5-C2]|nr:hypothetical protein BraRD5C2_24020 [Bradyrhizobium sp. RD5-C2]